MLSSKEDTVIKEEEKSDFLHFLTTSRRAPSSSKSQYNKEQPPLHWFPPLLFPHSGNKFEKKNNTT